jgi:hypothetical protein
VLVHRLTFVCHIRVTVERCVLAAQLPTIKDPAAFLALPPLSQVHLQSRMSPGELRKRAERAEWVAKVRSHVVYTLGSS